MLLEHFYKEVLHKEFGLKLYYKPHYSRKEQSEVYLETDKLLKPNEIMMNQIGDTRHFSMVNLVLNDFNPILIKDFAGHEDINTSYHYFNHIKQIVKCMSYYKFQELKKEAIDITAEATLNNQVNLRSIARSMEIKGKTVFKEVDYGKCYSDKFIRGDIFDCIPIMRVSKLRLLDKNS